MTQPAKQVQPKLLTIQDYETRRVYNYVAGCITDDGMGPTLREIGAHCHMSHVQAHRHVQRLVSLGYLTRSPKTARSLQLVGGDQRQMKRSAVHEQRFPLRSNVDKVRRLRDLNGYRESELSAVLEALVDLGYVRLEDLYEVIGIAEKRRQREILGSFAAPELPRVEPVTKEFLQMYKALGLPLKGIDDSG